MPGEEWPGEYVSNGAQREFMWGMGGIVTLPNNDVQLSLLRLSFPYKQSSFHRDISLIFGVRLSEMLVILRRKKERLPY